MTMSNYVARGVYDGKRPLTQRQLDNARRVIDASNALAIALDALEMVRDADNDSRADGSLGLPSLARAKIDDAIAKIRGTK